MATMRLLGFRVTNFRSVEDSGWIDTDGITSLIGTNESGKTNLLIPLWKLRPAKDGAINPLSDYPRKRYNEIRSMDDVKKPVFIQTKFALDDSLAREISVLTGAEVEEVSVASVDRRYDGVYLIAFPNAKIVITIPKVLIETALISARDAIIDMQASAKAEEVQKEQILQAFMSSLEVLAKSGDAVYSTTIKQLLVPLSEVGTEAKSARSIIMPRFLQAVDTINDLLKQASRPSPSYNQDARNKVMANVPTFVYYSNYGNLDSEIYLPHVIENMKRVGLGGKEEAKVRTLKVLFDFVRLKPEEILQLGKDLPVTTAKPTEDQIKETADKKKEREVLLQSASTELTTKFKNWWKQGDYRFRFQADGDHFRIWVSDDRRPEEIELEGRSTGLQWFLSFYLIFLVESQDSHENSILLLDEPGLSLHPLAQKDLSAFFTNLSETNQLLYTTHSPFLVDSNHLDRVKAVYVGEDGTTAVSANLRASEGSGAAQSKSIYPVHAALGLSISDALLQGCQPVIVEGPSDQLYLSTIKNFLISRGKITPNRELIFMPAGGVRGIAAVVAIVAGKDEALPFVLLDSDNSGQSLYKSLTGNVYQGQEERIISIGDILGLPNAEIEDLMPSTVISKVADRLLRNSNTDDDFSDTIEDSKPIVGQIEAYATKNGVVLEKGWKVDLAAQAKSRITKAPNVVRDSTLIECWSKLFKQLDGDAGQS